MGWSLPIVHVPTVFALGPLTVSGYGVALAASLLLGYVTVAAEYRRRHVPAHALEDIILLAVLAIAGAKVYDVVVGDGRWGDRGGFSMVGGGLTAIPMVVLLSRRRGVPWRTVADAAALGAAAAIPVARSGCWAIGDDYGRPTDLPWAVQFPTGAPPSTAGILSTRFHEAVGDVAPDTVLAVHPTQLYELTLGMALFLWLWPRRQQARPLAIAGWFLLLSGLSRFLVEFVRAKADRAGADAVTTTQYATVLLMLGGVALLRRPRDAGEGTGSGAR